MKGSRKYLLLIILIIFAAALTACTASAQRNYTVSFQTNEGSAVQTEITSVIAESPVTARAGYRFIAWCSDEALEKEVTFPYAVKSDTTLYAKWQKVYSIEYKIDGISYYKENYAPGETIAVLSNPSKTGYQFSGWRDEIPQVMPEENIIINGNFIAKVYYICFKPQDGVTITGTTKTYTTTDNGEQVTYPCIEVTFGRAYSEYLNNVVASKDNYDFETWTYYDTKERKRKDYVVTDLWSEDKNILLTAKWVQEGTVGLVYTLNEDKDAYIISDYTRNNQSVIIPATYNNKPVTEIGEFAFYQSTNLVSVTLPSTIIKIGNSAFRSCTSLKNINIPVSVTDIGASAFESCTALKSIEFTSKLKAISNSMFADCVSLENVKLVNGELSKIGESAFFNAKKLKTLIIPQSVSTLGNFAFQNCESLETISIQNTGIKVIGTGVFMGCKSLTEITLPLVTGIGSQAFQDCISLRAANIPNSVIEIGFRAYYGCTALTSVRIPISVTRIKAEAFYNCDSLSEIKCQASSAQSGWETNWNLKLATETAQFIHAVQYSAFS